MLTRTSVPWLLMLLFITGVVVLGLSEKPASADFSDESISDLARYVQSGNALSLRLMALEELKNKTGTTVDDELLAIAKGSDFRMAVYATTALGKRKTSTSKAKLKMVLENSKLKKDVRMAAMTAIAVHFKTSIDLTYLWSKASSDQELTARYYWLKQHVYNMGGK